jgi:hypothetical protein
LQKISNVKADHLADFVFDIGNGGPGPTQPGRSGATAKQLSAAPSMTIGSRIKLDA